MTFVLVLIKQVIEILNTITKLNCIHENSRFVFDHVLQINPPKIT